MIKKELLVIFKYVKYFLKRLKKEKKEQMHLSSSMNIWAVQLCKDISLILAPTCDSTFLSIISLPFLRIIY